VIHGVDTSFLVAVEVLGHPQHTAARSVLDRVLSAREALAIAPQVLAEFIHVVTDPRRFEKPLNFAQACERTERWWNAEEVVAVFPREHTVTTMLNWLREHSLGRKRLLDTLLAATYLDNEISSILTTNARDFGVFGCFAVVKV
jgi:predicted nucleic acid-binding protein